MSAISVASLFAELKLDDKMTSPLKDAKNKLGEVENSAKNTERGVNGLGNAIRGLGSAIAAAGLVGFLGSAVAGARDAAAASRQLDAVLESTADVTVKVWQATGGLHEETYKTTEKIKDATGAHTKKVEVMKKVMVANGQYIEMERATRESILATSEALMKKTGIDDDEITKAQSLLLTFTRIGKEVMPLATETVLDMAAAMGTDAKSAALMVGKALQSAEGVTALTRAGVTFTKQEQAKIKALFASGKIMEAQKIILAELNNEFGGSAAAQADGITRLQTAWGNFMEGIGGAVLPILDGLARMLTDVIYSLEPFIPTIAAVVSAFGAFAVATGPLGAILGTILGPIGLISVAIAGLVAAWNNDFLGLRTGTESFVNSIKPTLDDLSKSITSFFQTLTGETPKTQLNMRDLLTANLPEGDQNILQALKLNMELTPEQRAGLSRDGKKVYDEVLSIAIPQTISAPTGLGERLSQAMIELLPKLTAGLSELMTKARTWLENDGKQFLEAGFKAAIKFVGDIASWVKANAPDIIGGILVWLSQVVSWLSSDNGGKKLIRDAVQTALNFTTSVVQFVADNMPDLTFAIGGWIGSAVDWLLVQAPIELQKAINSLFSGTSVDGTGLLTALGTVLGADGPIWTLFDGLFGKEKGTIGTMVTDFFAEDGVLAGIVTDGGTIIQTVWDKLFGKDGGLMATVNALGGLVSGAISRVRAAVVNVLKGILDPLKTLLQATVILLNAMGDKANAIKVTEGIAAIEAFQATPSWTGGDRRKGQTLLVGEKGPELITMPAAGRVIANHQLSGAYGGGGGSSGTMNIGSVYITGNDNPEKTFDDLQKVAARRNIKLGSKL